MAKYDRKTVLDERIQDLEKVIDILTVLRDHPEIGEKTLCEEHGISFNRYRKYTYDTDWFDHTRSTNSEETSLEKMKDIKPTLSWYHNLWCNIMGLDYRDVAVCPTDVDTTIEWLLKTRLSPREGNIIRMRYEEGMKLLEIGHEYNITRYRVAQIEEQAIRKLRNYAGWLQLGVNHWVPALKIQQTIEQNLEVAVTHRVLAALDNRIPSLRKFINDGIKNEIAEKGQNDPDIPITDLGLSIRSINCLRRANITTINELRLMTASDLMIVRNLGASCVSEIQEKLGEYGFSLLPDDSKEESL